MATPRSVRWWWRGALLALLGLLVVGTYLWWMGQSRAAARPAAPEPTPWTGTDTWPFEPARDDFSDQSLLDLRWLNERVAGETGFVHLDAQGELVRGDGRPIRFWAVNSDVARSAFVAAPLGPQVAPDLARHARFLAKRGVNMVRQHRQISPLPDTQPLAAITDINEAERDAIWRMVAAMRREGIYTTISPYWAGPMRFAPAWGIAGGKDQSAFGLLFFDDLLQQAYKSWLKKLLTEKNPYTGLTLARDPSVALIQIQNEDSLLFWTVDGIQGPQRQALERRYATFLTNKHGSLAQAVAAWNDDRDDADAPTAGRMGLLKIWEMTQPGKSANPRAAGRAARLADQTEFYARTMFDFNRMIVDYLRHELGVGSLVNAGNWKTASPALLNDAERWSYTPGDVDAVNRYSGGMHQGPNDGWAIVDGDRYASTSVLHHPSLLPVNIKQTAGRPMLLTEGSWVLPTQFAAEGPFLVAAYTSLAGVAGYYWFATGDEGWTPPRSANGYLPSLVKWALGTPETLGSFPAAALAYRLGYIKRGATAVHERRSLPDLWSRQPTSMAEDPGFDPNRDIARSDTAAQPRPPSDAFLVGPVLQSFDAGPTPPLSAPGAPTTSRAPIAVILSNTGELAFDPRAGVCRVDTPKAQGVAAHFAQAPEHHLSDVSLRSSNAYGSVWVVALDDLPLRSAGRVLVQVATQSRPTGWREVPASIPLDKDHQLPGLQIQSIGKPPWQVARARLELSLRNAKLSSATVLDMNGMPTGSVAVSRRGERLSFTFPKTAMYVLLR